MSTQKYDVYGIGNAIMDLQFELAEDELVSLVLEKGGMTFVDEEFHSNLLATHFNKEIKQSSGGSGANTIIALAQLGMSVAYGCIVGNDSRGLEYLSELKSLGVSLFNDPVKDGVTGLSVIMITPDAERTMATNLGITSTFGPEHVSNEVISDSSWIYLEGYLFATESGRNAIRQAISQAKVAGTKVALTLSDGFIVDSFKDSVTETLRSTDLLFANKNEATRFVGVQDEVEALRELKKIVKNVVITCGEKGVIASCEGEDAEVKAFSVTAVDDTGAGDMFAAGFLNGHLRGLPLETSLRIACFLAGKVVSQYGARIKGDLRALIQSEAGLVS